MERIQNSYQGQVKYLRGVRDYGTQQLTTIREQYNDQVIFQPFKLFQVTQ